MKYTVVYSKTALKEIKSLPKQYAKRVYEKSEMLADNPRPPGCKKLEGKKENIWRIRVGDYRILYSIEDAVQIVDIRNVADRKEVYR